MSIYTHKASLKEMNQVELASRTYPSPSVLGLSLFSDPDTHAVLQSGASRISAIRSSYDATSLAACPLQPVL